VKIEKYLLCLLVFFFIFICPLKVYSAEVLQVTSSSTILIGDNNRTYKIKQPCISVKPTDEIVVSSWIRERLPRRTKVNLRPKGAEDGVLLARVFRMGSDLDIAEELFKEGLIDSYC
tara:strand:+ start:497 stop:847 length:351 start_codon:yes stop_codon:yes gene_type:complete